MSRKSSSSRAVLHTLSFVLLLVTNINLTSAQQTKGTAPASSLEAKLREIDAGSSGTLGISVLVLETGEAVNLHGDEHLPMQSVYKFPIAVALLNRIDAGKLKLDSQILIPKGDLQQETWSPMYDKYPKGNVRLTVREVTRYMVSESDNNACDILLRLIGGPQRVEAYLASVGIKDMHIRKTENEMHHDWNAQFTNWSTPNEMKNLLVKFYQGKLLSSQSTAVLLEMMTKSTNSPRRLMGQLPAGTVVAHKTGTSGYDDKHRVFAATNDVGIISLPNGRHVVVAALLTMSKKQIEANEAILARAGKAVWDAFAK